MSEIHVVVLIPWLFLGIEVILLTVLFRNFVCHEWIIRNRTSLWLTQPVKVRYIGTILTSISTTLLMPSAFILDMVIQSDLNPRLTRFEEDYLTPRGMLAQLVACLVLNRTVVSSNRLEAVSFFGTWTLIHIVPLNWSEMSPWSFMTAFYLSQKKSFYHRLGKEMQLKKVLVKHHARYMCTII